MPELPEVQTIVNDLQNAGLQQATITRAMVFWPRSVAQPSAAEFVQRLRNRTVSRIWRRGKYIIFDCPPDQHLLIHLRMSGRLRLVPARQARSHHEHVMFSLKGGQQLRLHDTRKFARVYLTTDTSQIIGHLGPEPLEASFSAKVLAQRLHKGQRQLKPLLLDQTCIAGLGNIYVDEALWAARLHPCRRACTLSMAEVRRLHRAIRQVLRQGLANMGTTLGTGNANFYSLAHRQGRNQDQLRVFRRASLPCPRCTHPIIRFQVGQRGTHICPQCQVL